MSMTAAQRPCSPSPGVFRPAPQTAWWPDLEAEARTLRRMRLTLARLTAPAHDDPKKATVPSRPIDGFSTHFISAPPPPGIG